MQENRYIFVAKDDKNNLQDITLWIKRFLTEVDVGDISLYQGKSFSRLVPVKGDFIKVSALTSQSRWVDVDEWKDGIGEQVQNEDEENKPTETLDACLHDIADSLPCIGCLVHLYVFLSASDLNSENSFIPLAGAFLRFSHWHHSQVTIVKLDSELSSNGDKLVELVDSLVLPITKLPEPAQESWNGSISILEGINNGIVYPGFSFHCAMWEDILKQTFSSPQQGNVKHTRKLKSKEEITAPEATHSGHVCGQTIEILQEVDLKTFPLFLLSPWNFKLQTFCRTSCQLVDHLLETDHIGLLARLKVFHQSETVPTCGETKSMSTSAWKKHITASPSFSVSPLLAGDCVDSPSSYLHLLILPSCDKSSSLNRKTRARQTLQVKVVQTAHQIAHNILSVVRQQDAPNLWRWIPQKKSNSEYDEKVLESIHSLPVFKVEDLMPSIQLTSHCHSQPSDVSKDTKNQLKRAFKEMSRTDQTVHDVLQSIKNLNEERPEWVNETYHDLSKCPEWMALIAESEEQKSGVDSSSAVSSMKKLSSNDSKQISFEQILSVLNEETISQGALAQGQQTGENDHTFRKHSNSKMKSSDYDIYHYNSERDYNLEIKYAQIRDSASFQDTHSSFVTPQKTAVKQYHTIVPTRSSPRIKRTPRLSPKNVLESKKIFKHPQSLSMHSSSINQRKRAASFLSPDSDSQPSIICTGSAQSITPSASTPPATHKRVPFTTVLESSDSVLRRSPRKMPGPQLKMGKSKQTECGPSVDSSKLRGPPPSDPAMKMKRSERHMMRLKRIITGVLKEKGVHEDNPIYSACSKNLLNVSIILLKTLPNSKNLTNEMKSVVTGQVQQIINLEKRRSGIAL